MVFNSVEFLIFFVLVVSIYFLLPYKFRWLFLLLSSCIFYMAWNPVYILLLLFSSAINYYISLKISISKDKNEMKSYLIIALSVSLGILFIFKYLTLVNDTIFSFFSFIKVKYPFESLNIILPMGISFYTFQTLGYTIDVYKGKIKPEKAFLKLVLFIIFFPQLVAGPIERFDRLMPQLFKKRKFNIKRAINGVQIMLLGYFKKVVIADRLAIAVNTVYNRPQNYSGLYLFIATILFTFQIYCDFCGYSEIAIGCAKVFGIELMDNFQMPYFSKSIKEFWRRWHISLSNWLRDYIYIPLGGSKYGKIKKNKNLLLTFLASGLWHGANWTFVMWGLLHGLYQVLGDFTFKIRKRIKITIKLNNTYILKLLQIFITFGLVSFAWIFFRANTVSEAFYIVTNLFKDFNKWFALRYIYDVVTNMGLNLFEFIIAFISVLILIIYELLSRKVPLYKKINNSNIILKTIFYAGLIIIILTMGVYHSESQFIYFQF